MIQLEPRSLEAQRGAFKQRRFLATPLAGTIAWAIIGMAGIVLLMSGITGLGQA